MANTRRLFLKDCVPGDIVEDVYVLTNKQLAAASTGKFYIKAFVSDRTHQLTARMWNATRDHFNAMPDNGFLRMRGRVENYQNNLQLIIEQFSAAREGTYAIGDLLPQTTKDVPTMCAKVSELLGSIQNRHLAALMQAYLDDSKLMSDFCRAPAAMTFHHSFIGGLLEHTLNAMEVGDAVCKFYPGLSRDLVIAGIFLHDIAKTWELTYETAFGYSDGGQLVGHVVKSAMWVDQKAAVAEKMLGEKIPRPLIDVIQHIILSHHGKLEFGAAKLPATPEAIAVHMIEDMDAKLMMALTITRGESGVTNRWSEYHKALGGRLYRPDVAPADAVESEPTEEPANPSSAGGSMNDTPCTVGVDGAASDSPPLKLTISNPLFEAATPRHR